LRMNIDTSLAVFAFLLTNLNFCNLHLELLFVAVYVCIIAF
jgi:hypothetical protein